jgi:hypothetical protein
VYGARPVVNVFARQITDDLASLVKKLDETVAKHQDKQLCAFVVLLTENAEADAAKLRQLAQEQGIEHVPLTVFSGAAGPPNIKLSQDADVTVLMWQRAQVRMNHALKHEQLDDDAASRIIADTEKLLN